MLKVVIPAALLGLSAVATAAEYTIDPAHTYPHFAISHLGFSTLYGRFDETSGSLSLDREQGTGEVEIVIQAGSVNTGHAKRDEHLRSPDFLNAAEYPEITFRSTEVTFNGEDKATVEGELTLLGATRPVTLDVDHIACGAHPMNGKEVCGFNATTTINRSDFGVSYGIPAIGDEMRLIFGVEAYK